VANCFSGSNLAAGAAATAITLNVNIAANVPASITNTATVSGGGETLTTNNSASVTSTVAPPPALVSVVSRQAHAGSVYGLPIDFLQPINGAITVEPRSGGAGHTLMFTFDSPITSVNSTATVVDANNATLASPVTSAFGNNVTVIFGNIPDNQRVTVTLTGINGFSTANVSMGFMLGDFNSSRSVGANDISAVKSRSGQRVTSQNFMFDVNASGTISAADVAAVKTRLGTTLP
jgi:hypothetical protein